MVKLICPSTGLGTTIDNVVIIIILFKKIKDTFYIG